MMGNSGLDILYTDRDGTLQFDGQWVTPNTFEFLGMQPMLGRMITRADGANGAAPVFAMSHRLWKKQFNSDPSVVGKTFVLNGQPHTLVSVMPPRFLLGNADIWVPNNMNRSDPESQKLEFWLLARLKPGVTLQETASDFEVIARRLAKTYPNDFPKQFTVLVEDTDRRCGRAVQGDAVHAAGGGRHAAADRVQQCRQPTAGESDGAGARDCHPGIDGRQPRSHRAAIAGGEPDARPRLAACWAACSPTSD